jgi:hypothetical protein
VEQLLPAGVMAHVEIPLNTLTYRFRKLNWRKELWLSEQSTGGEALIRLYLTHALVEVVAADGRSLPVDSLADATRIVTQFPSPILRRIWMLYRASLPATRFFSTKLLYRAPEPRLFVKTLVRDEATQEDRADAATRQMESKFSRADIKQAREVEQQVLADAKRRNVLKPVTEDKS